MVPVATIMVTNNGIVQETDQKIIRERVEIIIADFLCIQYKHNHPIGTDGVGIINSSLHGQWPPIDPHISLLSLYTYTYPRSFLFFLSITYYSLLPGYYRGADHRDTPLSAWRAHIPYACLAWRILHLPGFMEIHFGNTPILLASYVYFHACHHALLQ